MKSRWVGLSLLPVMMIYVFSGPIQVNGEGGSAVTASALSVNGIKLTLSLPQQVYPLDALVRVTVRIQNAGQHTVLTWIGDGCTSTNPSIEVFGGRGRLMDQGPSIEYDNPGCRAVFGQPFPPGRVVVRRVFAVLRGPYLRAALAVGKNLHGQDVSAKLAVRLAAGAAPTVTVDQTGEPAATVSRPPGATGPLYYSGSALCGTAADPQPTQVNLLWSSVSSPLHSGCLQTREWHGLAGYLNYPVVPIDWKPN